MIVVCAVLLGLLFRAPPASGQQEFHPCLQDKPLEHRAFVTSDVPGFGASRTTAERLIDRVNQAADAGTLVVFRFHEVGGGAWFSRNRDKIWTGPFIKVMEHVIAERKRLGWNATG